MIVWTSRGDVLFRMEYLKFKFDIGSIHKRAMKDRHFRKNWKAERLIRMHEQPFCKYCDEKFSLANSGVLHHKKMSKKLINVKIKRADIGMLVEIGKINKEKGQKKLDKVMADLLSYYKTLKHTDLICGKCHSLEHSNFFRRKRFSQLL